MCTDCCLQRLDDMFAQFHRCFFFLVCYRHCTRTHARTYMHALHTYTYTYTHTRTHTHTYIHTYTHTRTYIHIHTHTHTHTHHASRTYRQCRGCLRGRPRAPDNLCRARCRKRGFGVWRFGECGFRFEGWGLGFGVGVWDWDLGGGA